MFLLLLSSYLERVEVGVTHFRGNTQDRPIRHIQRTIVELVGCHVKMPRIFFAGLEPERGRHGSFLFEFSEKVRPGFDLFIYQRSLVRGSTPFTLSVTPSKGLPPAIFPVSGDRWTPYATRD
jgi:hypothetical protein